MTLNIENQRSKGRFSSEQKQFRRQENSRRTADLREWLNFRLCLGGSEITVHVTRVFRVPQLVGQIQHVRLSVADSHSKKA